MTRANRTALNLVIPPMLNFIAPKSGAGRL